MKPSFFLFITASWLGQAMAHPSQTAVPAESWTLQLSRRCTLLLIYLSIPWKQLPKPFLAFAPSLGCIGNWDSWISLPNREKERREGSDSLRNQHRSLVCVLLSLSSEQSGLKISQQSGLSPPWGGEETEMQISSFVNLKERQNSWHHLYWPL